MSLQFHIQAIAEQPQQPVGADGGQTALSGDNRAIERAIGSAGQRYQAVRMALQPPKLYVGRLDVAVVEKGARIEIKEIAVAGLARRQQHDPRQRRRG